MKTIVGLTGGYCSGKNEAAQTMAQEGFHLIDVDLLGHKALESSTKELEKAFGKVILDPDGRINRRALGDIVFSSAEKLQLHESIVHPTMLSLLNQEIEAYEKVCINAALLYRFPQALDCDLIIEMRAPFFTRVKRGQNRDRLSVRDILKRISNQHYLWDMRPSGGPEIVYIDNDGDLAALGSAIKAVLDRLSARRAASRPNL